MNFRVGMGYDVHRLVDGRDCMIGGLKFNHPKGLLGHSDADVLLHAIADALLGALSLGDLGTFFPDSDPQYKNANSRDLLKLCYAKVVAKGYQINNVDTIIVCEAPKIKPRCAEMQSGIAEILNCSLDRISIKATTEEKMGFTGRGEGIAAWAYASLISS